MVNIKAVPHNGFIFLNWKHGNTILSENPNHSFNMLGNDMVITANTAKSYTLSLLAEPSGVAEVSGVGEYAENSIVSISTTLIDDDYEFEYWLHQDEIISTTAEFDFTMPGQDVSLVSKYKHSTNNNENSKNSIKIYPNPSKGVYSIVVEKDFEMNLLDLTGRKVLSMNIMPGTNRLDIQYLSDGIYYLQLTNNIDNKTIKIIKN